jgi:hypothetical protein
MRIVVPDIASLIRATGWRFWRCRSSTLNFWIPYPRGPDLPYPERVLSNEGPLSRGDPAADRAKAGRTGAPRNGRQADGQVERREAQRLPWARAVPCRARWVRYSRLKGARWCPGASRRSIPSRGSRGTGKARTQRAARTRACGCLKFESVRSPDGAQRNPGQALQHSRSPGFRCAPSGLRRFSRVPGAMRRVALRKALRPGHEPCALRYEIILTLTCS